jgi:hypothetical protein
VGRVEIAGETSLAAATAAIITARWSAASHKIAAPSVAPAPLPSAPVSGPPDRNGYGTDDTGFESGLDGGRANGHSGDGGHAVWAPRATNGNGHSNGHPFVESPADGFGAPEATYPGPNGNGNGHGHAAPPDALAAPPPEPPGRHDSAAFGSAAASFFAATHVDAVPELFPTARIPGQRGGSDDFSLGSVMSDLPFPEPFDAYEGDGFSAFSPATPPSPPPPAPPLAPDEVTGTRVPPGFERRTFSPFADDPAPEFVSEAPSFFPEVGEFGAFDKPSHGQGVTQFGEVSEFAEYAPPEFPSEVGPQSFASSPFGGTPFGTTAPPELPPLSFPPAEFSSPSFGSSPFGGPAPMVPTPDQRHPESRHPESRHPESRHPESRHAERRESEHRQPEQRHGERQSEARHQDSPVALLPRRTPQVPDVPEFALFANDPLLDPSTQPADGTDLTRIADYLSSTDVLTEYKPDGFDFADVLEAVKGVRDVRDAHLRWNSGAGHTLRIEFTDDADEAEVTRTVVRLLREKMGLAAGPSIEEPTLDRPTPRPRSSVVASASVPVRPPAASTPAVKLTRENPLPRPSDVDTALPRVVVDHVQVTTLGTDATVEVRLLLSRGGRSVGAAVGTGQGPAVDAYLLRLAATSAGNAVDELLAGGGDRRGRCFVEHVTVVPFGVVEVAIVVLLLAYDGHTEQLAGSAIVSGDPRQAVVRATLAALNRRLESLLA